MKSFASAIAELDQFFWNYYQNGVACIDKIESFNDSDDFIKRYFEVADKRSILIKEDKRNPILQKSKHVVSVYFLGALINEILWPYPHIFNSKSGKDFKSDFLFVWFLTCLYHDYYFEIEDKKRICEEYPNITRFQKGFNVSYNLLRRKPEYIPSGIKKSIVNYYKYRIRKWNVVDHGIAGGIIMFDKLIGNRRQQEEEQATGARPSPLNFSKFIEKFYVEASYAVAAHNIFFPNNEDDIHIYQKHNLDSLINQDKISYKSAPFLFFLGLVDTIDPVKTFNCLDPDYVARHVYLDIQEKRDKFIISLLVAEPLNYEKIASKAQTLDNWLELSVDCFPKDSKIVISFCSLL